MPSTNLSNNRLYANNGLYGLYGRTLRNFATASASGASEYATLTLNGPGLCAA
jgi:hypothetical protein